MKFNLEIEIDKPIDKVVALFNDPENMKKWMEGLQSFETFSGTQGEVGAKSSLKFKMRNRDVELIETILVNNLPNEFSCTYETNGVFNVVKNYFKKNSDTKTKYSTDQEFQFKGFMKFIAFLMPGAFKKQSKKYLVDFKNFVESQH